MEKSAEKNRHRTTISYSAEICRRIFLYSVLKGVTTQKIHIEALEFWLDHQDAKRLEAQERFGFIDKD
jgi:hypothetical protein